MDSNWHEIVAPAKLNLCLQVLGKRRDGYHEVLSFACFTTFGDRLSVAIAEKASRAVWPFCLCIKRSWRRYTIAKVTEMLRQADIALPPLHIRLEKNIPLGGGLGGGSADAAAFLRLIADKILPQQITPHCF